jgi:hypothetical protein
MYDSRDMPHVLKRLICPLFDNKLKFVKYEAWEKCSTELHHILPPKLFQGAFDRLSVPQAALFVHIEVEKWMKKNGYTAEAKFINIVREWVNAFDRRGLSKERRLKKVHALREYFIELGGSFLPDEKHVLKIPSADVCGIPIETFEALLVTCDVLCQIHEQFPTATIIERSLSTDDLENFFAIFHERCATSKPNALEVLQNFNRVFYIKQVKMTSFEERGFHMKTSRRKKYWYHDLNAISWNDNSYNDMNDTHKNRHEQERRGMFDEDHPHRSALSVRNFWKVRTTKICPDLDDLELAEEEIDDADAPDVDETMDTIVTNNRVHARYNLRTQVSRYDPVSVVSREKTQTIGKRKNITVENDRNKRRRS